MKRRHPHVFGSARARTFRQAYSLWQRAKEAEHRIQSRRSVLDDLGPGVPALMRADKIQRRVARVGFDWPDQAGVVAKIEEELAEFKRELRRPRTSQRKLQEELGDMLFALANLGRKLDLSSEIALRKTNAKFIKRFRALEKRLADAHQRLGTVPLRVLDRYWNAVKRDERSPGRPSHSRVRKKAAQRGG
jgi:MazG family protein